MKVLMFLLFIYCYFRAAPIAYRDSQARGQIGATGAPHATAIVTQDPSHVCDLHHSSQHRQFTDPLSEARDQTRILMDPRQVH